VLVTVCGLDLMGHIPIRIYHGICANCEAKRVNVIVKKSNEEDWFNSFQG
jgi:hypothetical protein